MRIQSTRRPSAANETGRGRKPDECDRDRRNRIRFLVSEAAGLRLDGDQRLRALSCPREHRCLDASVHRSASPVRAFGLDKSKKPPFLESGGGRRIVTDFAASKGTRSRSDRLTDLPSLFGRVLFKQRLGRSIAEPVQRRAELFDSAKPLQKAVQFADLKQCNSAKLLREMARRTGRR